MLSEGQNNSTMDTRTSNLTTQVVNVSGTRFEMSETTWAAIKKDMSGSDRCAIRQTGSEVFLERHAGVFQSILYYHQGGELHLPENVCPSSFRAELRFYGVNEGSMAKCCFMKFINYFDDQAVLKILEDDESKRRAETSKLIRMHSRGGWRGVQGLVWLVLNEPFYSRAAKVYFLVSAAVVLVSLFALVAGTDPSFQRDLTIDEWEIYFGDDWHKYKYRFIPEAASVPETEPEVESEPDTISEPEVTSEPETAAEAETTSEPEPSSAPDVTSEPEMTSEPETTAEPETTPEPETAPGPEVVLISEPESQDEPVPMPENAFVRHSYLEHIEYISLALFSLDLCARIIFCPFRYNLLFSFLHWVDVFSLAVMYARYIVEALHPKEKYEASPLDILHCLQIVRVFRLIRLVKNFVGFRVLMYAFKASFKEMMLMNMFLFIAMLIFSTFAFFSGDETFTSIPDACWWAIVTMTTVGYGDIVPKRDFSRFIGVVCALSGVCLIAVIVPIFVNNFMLFYSYTKVWGQKSDNDKMEKNRHKITQVVSIEELNGQNRRY